MGTFVLFIGGFQSTLGDVNRWTASGAQQQPTGWTFDGYPWPPSAARFADAAHGIAAFSDMADAVKKIEDGKYDTVYIVGHSSGCAIANKIDETLEANNKVNMKSINLVALDGFAPSPGQLSRPTTQVWSAENGAAKSLNYWKLLKRLQGKLKVYPAGKDCSNIWSLHFSLVNSNSSDKWVSTNQDLDKGYQNCRANLCWVPPAPATP